MGFFFLSCLAHSLFSSSVSLLSFFSIYASLRRHLTVAANLTRLSLGLSYSSQPPHYRLSDAVSSSLPLPFSVSCFFLGQSLFLSRIAPESRTAKARELKKCFS